MSTIQYDAIVVGSGISGGWAAKELTEKGLNVLLLERGRDIEHIKDYVNATKESWEFPHRGIRPTQQMLEDYPVLKRDYPLNETVLDLWVKDKECPYTETKPSRGSEVIMLAVAHSCGEDRAIALINGILKLTL
jgi:choline dehydrogenase-like flavoprotein